MPQELRDYAEGIRAMKALPLSDPMSLDYQSAIHGRNGERNRQDPDWDWCQHQNWFFLPWHRMYLRQFERIVGHLIGKRDWRIPYWDYTGADSATWALPPEFLDPADASNPLWAPGRLTSAINEERRDATRGLDPRFFSSGGELRFGFGSGRVTAPSQFGGATGTIEQWPHNVIHMAVGGRMANPATAALDPLFWLHHANVDRLWGVWLAIGRRFDPRGRAWLDTTFTFPRPGSATEKDRYRVRDVLDTTSLGYTYDDASTPEDESVLLAVGADETEPPEPELVGATTRVKMDPGASVRVELEEPSAPALLADAGAAGAEPENVFLQLEGIKGVDVAVGIYGLYVNVPEGDPATDHPELKAGILATFGLELATQDGHGMTQAFKITDIARRLRAEGRWDPAALRVSFEEETFVSEDADASQQDVTVDRISVFYV